MNKLPKAFKVVPWRTVLFVALISFFVVCRAEDYLDGTLVGVNDTIFNGTGKKWIYVLEGLGCGYAYIKTKNVFVLFGVIVIAIFLTILAGMVGT